MSCDLKVTNESARSWEKISSYITMNFHRRRHYHNFSTIITVIIFIAIVVIEVRPILIPRAGLFKARLRELRVSAKFEFKYENLKRNISLILFVNNLMIG